MWAVLLSIASSSLTVGGFVIQKKANEAPRRASYQIGDIVLSGPWLAGFLVAVVVPVPVQVWTYGLAPMSLTTPLGGVSVLLNMAFAPLMLGERLQWWPDMPASVFILAGTVLTTMAGSHEDSEFTFSELVQLLGHASVMWALLLLVGTIAGCMGYMEKRRPQIEMSAMQRPLNPNIFEVSLPAVVAAGCGCLTNISLKGVGELLKGGAEFGHLLMWLLTALMTALAQLNYINRGLRLYLQTVFFPVYSALLVLTNTLYGLIFYQEYGALVKRPDLSVLFAVGILAIVLGVVLFTFRRSDCNDSAHGASLAMELAPGLGLSAGAEMGSRGARRNISGVIGSHGGEIVLCDAQRWRIVD